MDSGFEHSEAVVHFSNGDSNSGSLLVQIFLSGARGLLLIAGENAWLMVVTTLKNSILQLEICSIK